MAYLLDSNVFIEAKNHYYGFDFCPGFWDWLINANARGEVLSIEKVKDELRGPADDLAGWANARDDGFFVAPDDEVVESMRLTSEWVNGCGTYDDAGITAFLAGADYYLVAHGHAHVHVVVTRERSAPQSRKSVKIPDACAAMDVECITPFEMLRQCGAQFVLQR